MANRKRVRIWAGRFALAAFAVFLLLQLKQPDRSNPPVVSTVNPPAEIAAILKRSCFSCHSHETDWPWYAYVAPVSWWIVDHVNDGRGDLNFSQWPVLDLEELEHSFRDIDAQIARGEMPLKSYLIMHPSARLSEQDKAALRGWAQSNF